MSYLLFVYSGVQHLLTIGTTWHVSYKRHVRLTLCEDLAGFTSCWILAVSVLLIFYVVFFVSVVLWLDVHSNKNYMSAPAPYFL